MTGRPGDIVDVIVIVSVIIFLVSLNVLSRSSCKKMLKDGSLRVGSKGELSQMVTYLVCDGLEYRFKVLIGRVRQATKDVVKSEV